jgi:hypothetical protein
MLLDLRKHAAAAIFDRDIATTRMSRTELLPPGGTARSDKSAQ